LGSKTLELIINPPSLSYIPPILHGFNPYLLINSCFPHSTDVDGSPPGRLHRVQLDLRKPIELLETLQVLGAPLSEMSHAAYANPIFTLWLCQHSYCQS
jgi:hypothetical protein